MEGWKAMKPLQLAVSVVALITAVGGGTWALDSHWTPRVMFAGFQEQYQQDRSVDLLDRTNDRIWEIDQKLKKDPTNEELARQKKLLENRKQRLEKQVDPKKEEGG
jgi:uncharacterized protein YaaR (DUF327 family)